jgi:ATP-dependent DNA helicase RecQ
VLGPQASGVSAVMSSAPSTAQRVRSAARTAFGHDDLLPGQAEATAALLEHHDVLLVSPTGSGKSLVYQVAGMLLGGCTVVVSPLLALQQDQIRSIDESPAGVRAARLSSAESASKRASVLDGVQRGEIRFLFLSPEQLVNDEVRTALARAAPRLVSVDEAHCVSAWGHDFRPDYFRLGELIADLGRPRVVAMTATAAPPVRDDIARRLAMRDCRTVVTGFARDNLAFDVLRCATQDEQRRRVLDLVADQPADAAGIVYCRTRPTTEEYADALAATGRRTAVYHAGLGHARRERTHEAFMSGDVDTVVATSAFGMGIDKPDIRFVVHAQVPESPDTYYQEVGRGGRDGEPATAALVYRPEDLSLGRFFTGGVPRAEDVARVLESVAAVGAEPADVHRHSGLGRRKAGRILNLLHLVEEIRSVGSEEKVDAVLDLAESQRKLERSRVDMMRAYAETDRCRAEFLLRYFGDEAADRCGTCDNCRDGVAAETLPDTDAAFPLQSRVAHEEFGVGLVTDLEDDRVTVLFDDVGYRTLSLAVIEEQGLLKAR